MFRDTILTFWTSEIGPKWSFLPILAKNTLKSTFLTIFDQIFRLCVQNLSKKSKETHGVIIFDSPYFNL